MRDAEHERELNELRARCEKLQRNLDLMDRRAKSLEAERDVALRLAARPTW
jgi:hypothetical protein